MPVADSSFAVVGDHVHTGLAEVTSDLGALDGSGTWVVVLPFDGVPVCARFTRSDPLRAGSYPVMADAEAWVGVDPDSWRSSLDESGFRTGVDEIRTAIGAGVLDQVNLTRLLRAPIPAGADVGSLGAALALDNPAPYAAVVCLPGHGIHIASASPEQFLRREGPAVSSSPIKGTASTEAELLPKDRLENELVTGVVAAELARECEPDSVSVSDRLRLEQHPGLVHLVSTVTGRLRADVGWVELLEATFPPASVTGTPRDAARDVISRLEPVSRGLYCGAIGVVDADAGIGSLNVAIRTFWFEDGEILFGTGGGITAGSDPAGEWVETELKARRLLEIAAGGRPT